MEVKIMYNTQIKKFIVDSFSTTDTKNDGTISNMKDLWDFFNSYKRVRRIFSESITLKNGIIIVRVWISSYIPLSNRIIKLLKSKSPVNAIFIIKDKPTIGLKYDRKYIV